MKNSNKKIFLTLIYATALCSCAAGGKESTTSSASSSNILESSEVSSSDIIESSLDISTSSEEILSSDTSVESSEDVTSSEVHPYEYTDFTDEEKALFMNYFGIVPPFLPTSEYVFNDRFEESGYIYYYTINNTEDEVDAFLNDVLVENYELTDRKDDYGCIPEFTFALSETVQLRLTYTIENNVSYTNIYVSLIKPVEHTYKDFKSEEKATMMQYFGIVIPFIENDYYSIKDDYSFFGYINFYTYNNTNEEYEAYKAVLDSTYTYVNSETDKNDHLVHTYNVSETVQLTLSFYPVVYSYATEDCVDVYIINTAFKPEFPERTYNEFTDAEATLLLEKFGEVMPFLPNDYYYIDPQARPDINKDIAAFYCFYITELEYLYYSNNFFEIYEYQKNYRDRSGFKHDVFLSENNIVYDVSAGMLGDELEVTVYIYAYSDTFYEIKQ